MPDPLKTWVTHWQPVNAYVPDGLWLVVECRFCPRAIGSATQKNPSMLPVFWGKRERHQRLGQVAEFCDRCLCITRHQLFAHLETAHLYFVPLVNRELNRECFCSICGNLSLEERKYCVIEPIRRQPTPIMHLVERTNPDLMGEIDRLLEFIERFSSPSERHDYIATQFLAAQDQYIARHLAHKSLWALGISTGPLASALG